MSFHPQGSRPARPVTVGRRPTARSALALFLAAPPGLAIPSSGPLAAQEEHAHQEGSSHHARLHFFHPMIAESVSPDTKVRIDHQFFDFPDGAEEHSGVLEAEYAFHPGFSIEVGLPYTYTQTALGNLEVMLKFANYAFEEAGLLLGYGVEMGFPTNGSPDGHADEHHEDEPAATRAWRFPAAAVPGPEALAKGGVSRIPGPGFHTGGSGVAGTLGTQEYEIAPFLNLGLQRGGWELVGWLIFEIPFHQETQEEVAAELAWNASVLYEVSPRLQALLELDGSGGISGESVGEDVVNVAPGVKLAPAAGRPLFLGVSAGFPLADEEPFDARLKASLFWHF